MRSKEDHCPNYPAVPWDVRLGGADFAGVVVVREAMHLERFGVRSLRRGYTHKENVRTEQQKEVTD